MRPLRRRELQEALATLWNAHESGQLSPGASLEQSTHTDSTELSGSMDSVTQMVQATVLVAEDNVVNQMVAFEILTNLGCSVDIVGDGVEAVGMCENYRYDIVFLDCQMPRMDGYTAATEIRKREQKTSAHLPIVAMTAHAMVGDRERCLEAGMDEYLSKPVSPEMLLNVLRRMLPGRCTEIVRQSDMRSAEQTAARQSSATASGKNETLRLSSNAPVLDLDMALSTVGGKRRIFDRIKVVFMEEMPVRMQSLRAALETEDLSECHRLAHSIKGAAASIGGRRFAETAGKMEVDARDRRIADVKRYITVLEDEFDALERELRAT
jgi:CheY-like chemotaxis protein/HPt (histidine-containing phosphotransfer) domain-containing protein